MIPRTDAEARDFLRARETMIRQGEAHVAHLRRVADAEERRVADLRADTARIRSIASTEPPHGGGPVSSGTGALGDGGRA